MSDGMDNITKRNAEAESERFKSTAMTKQQRPQRFMSRFAWRHKGSLINLTERRNNKIEKDESVKSKTCAENKSKEVNSNADSELYWNHVARIRLNEVNKGKQVREKVRDRTIMLRKSKLEVRRHYLKVIVLDPNHKVHKKEVTEFIAIFQQSYNSLRDWSVIEDVIKKWENNSKPQCRKSVAKLLKISASNLDSLNVYPTSMTVKMIECLKKLTCHFNFVDICKIDGMSAWQQGNFERSAYMFSEALGIKLKKETIHKNFKQTNDRYKRSYMEPLDDKEKQANSKVFNQRIKDNLNFGKDMDSFYSDVHSLNSNWNICQFTSGLHSKCRFGKNYVRKTYNPTLFLTTFNGVMLKKSKSTFITNLSPPEENGMPCNLMARFQNILKRNKQNTSLPCTISRAEYWNRRKVHNQALKEFTVSMEDWVGFWTFLLPGNIKSTNIQNKIKKTVKDIGLKINRTLNDHEQLFLYKLIENFNFLQISVKQAYKYIGMILNISPELNQSLIEKVASVSYSFDELSPRHPTILILDNVVESMPWECLSCLRTTDVTRMPSIGSLKCLVNTTKAVFPKCPSVVKKNQCTFIVNSDGSLKKTQERLETYFRSRPSWVPFVAQKPTLQEAQQILKRKEIMLYCGHGTGSTIFPDFIVTKLLCQSIPLIMGCSSVRLKGCQHRRFPRYIVNAYLSSGCVSMVGFLWDITDLDCDRLTMDLLERWVPGSDLPPTLPLFDSSTKRDRTKCLATAVRLSRDAAVNFLTGAGIVNYGLPINTTD